MRRTLIVFAREPRIGRVKSRLARDIGRVAAWRFHRDTTAGLLRRVAGDGRWRVVLAVTPDRSARVGTWPRGIAVVPQGAGDLGRRMERALMAAPGPAVLIGSDIPDAGPRQVAAAFRALQRADVVFGPAVDGGYWLVGVRRPRFAHDLFGNVRWSTPAALADTRANVPPTRRVALVDTLIDVDTAEDLKRVG